MTTSFIAASDFIAAAASPAAENTVPVNYFDGRSARLHPVQLDVSGGTLTLTGAGVDKSYGVGQARLAEAFASGPCIVDFDDGARLEAGPAARAALERALGYRPGRVARWQQRWPVALGSLVLLVATLGAALKWGIPAAGERIVAITPASVDITIGDRLERGVRGKVLFRSRLSDERIAEVQAIFHSVMPARPRIPITLKVMEMRRRPPNAMALPNGTVVMTDALILHVLGKSDQLDEYMRAQLAGVLAHEIGHVQGRHGMRALARSSLTAIGAAALFGDFSTVVALAPTLLLQLDYSRTMETEADVYAVRRMHAIGLSTIPLADLFDSLMPRNVDKDQRPAWLVDHAGYLSSHPPSDTREALFRAAPATGGDGEM